MTETQLEDDLRATFRAAAESVPTAADLAPRAAEGVRRDRRSWTASGAAVVAVVAVAVAGTALDDSPEPAPQAAAPAPSVAAPTVAIDVATVQGRWQAARISGFNRLRAQRPDQPFLAFDPDGTWSGSDGCNSLSGTYSIGPNGELTTTNHGQRLVGCYNVPHIQVLSTAARVEISPRALRFVDSTGKDLAMYSRTS